MLEKIRLYDPADLERVITKGRKTFPDEAAWVRKLLWSFVGIVKRLLAAYRSFGPCRWPLKAPMIKTGELVGRDDIDRKHRTRWKHKTRRSGFCVIRPRLLRRFLEMRKIRRFLLFVL